MVTTLPLGLPPELCRLSFRHLQSARIEASTSPAPPQLAVQFTPRPGEFGSFATVAFSVACAPCIRAAGGGVVIVTEIGATEVIVTVAVADCVGSVVEVAVIVTVLPAGIADGALNDAAAPLAVWM